MKSLLYRLFLLLLLITTGIGTHIHFSTPESSDDNPLLRSDTFSLQKPDPATVDFSSTEETISLLSWNIQHLGRSKSDQQIKQMAQIMRNFDIVAIQEVVAKDPAGAQAVARLADALNRMGFQWDYQVSDPTQSPSPYIRERYAFLWKPSRVTMFRRAKLDQALAKKIDREPFIATFRKRGEKDNFHIINFHSRPYNRNPEEEIIHFFHYPNRFDSDRIILAGDFNLDEHHPVWKPFYQQGLKNALYDSPTTLKRKCDQGNYLNHAIDNFYYYPGIKMTNAGSVDFVKSCDQLHQARKISDHLPVYMHFDIKTRSNAK